MKKGYLDALGSKKMIKDQGLLRHEDIRHRLTILPELQALIPPLLPDELSQLETNIRRDGCREALLVWETTQGIVQQTEDLTPAYVLIDGHNRYTICQKNGLDFRMNLRSFSSMEEVRSFMIENQLGRRNLTPEQTSYLRGLRYRQEKGERGQYDRSGHKGQNVPYEQEATESSLVTKVESSSMTTAQRLAKQYNVNEKTIKRDAEFAAGVNKLNPDLRIQFLAGKLSINKSAIQQLGKTNLPDESVDTMDELMASLLPIQPAPVTEKSKAAGQSSSLKRKANAMALRVKLQNLLTQIAEPSEKDLELCDEIITYASQLKSAIQKGA
ncbi:hypothetical protein F5984_23715 [Rudanella paleaurantiibacter]|uniref:ParB/Sulfiredoxin domain-containing protein n=1 Tax=Rudanella paleaurantiibacter TaxID=2614655 RepID=A0A7J5TSW6_9BACT|nr:hypothetical protein [Rudanella paleaurantiibacter]KAB7726638.1 hypothetical protein F5984_23715 [Rudanella paleaurantiibacter]